MAKTQAQIWLDFAIQQLAAESYLDGVNFSDKDNVTTRLKLGTNHPDYLAQNRTAGIKDHATRMTTSQADTFFKEYKIIHHIPNHSSGFSGTLLRNKSGEYTLSMRRITTHHSGYRPFHQLI